MWHPAFIPKRLWKTWKVRILLSADCSNGVLFVTCGYHSTSSSRGVLLGRALLVSSLPVRWSGLRASEAVLLTIHYLCLRRSKEGGRPDFVSLSLRLHVLHQNIGQTAAFWRPLRSRLLAGLSIRPEMRAHKGHSATLFTSFRRLIILYRCSLKVVLLTYYSA